MAAQTPMELVAQLKRATRSKEEIMAEAAKKKVRLTRAERRAAYEKQIGHKVGVPKGKHAKK